MLNENLVERIAETLNTGRRRPAFTDWDGATLTYGDVVPRLRSLQGVFAVCGLQPGDRVALAGRNCAHWTVVYLATITYGAVIVPILPDFTGEEIQHIVNHSGARLFYVSDNLFDRIDERRLKHTKAIVSLRDFRVLHATDASVRVRIATAAAGGRSADDAALDPIVFPPVARDALATIVYTSGTTGFSKGVMLSHNALMANVRFFIDNLAVRPDDTVVSFLPLAHSFGCAFEFLAPVLAGCHITFVEKLPTPKVLLEAFAAVRPRVILSVPLIIEKIYKNRIRPQLESPRLQLALRAPLLGRVMKRKIREKVAASFGGNFQEVVVGGAALNREIEHFFHSIGFPLACGYGLTECGPLVSYTVVAENPPPGSVGRVIPYLECKIAETDRQRGFGEILVRGENVMQGYYKDTEATRAAIDAEGWLHTGDLGRIDRDGFLYLTGRSKNVIISASGQNVYPEEIEAQLNNLPFVAESLVLDDNGRLVALVYPDVERADEENVGEKELATIMEQNRAALNRRLPAFSQVARCKLIFEEFEKTPTKKIKRRLYDAIR
jgi:long-chain acyl-CoA synthetase